MRPSSGSAVANGSYSIARPRPPARTRRGLLPPATSTNRMSAALAIGGQLRQAREDLTAFDDAVRLRRIEPDPTWRTEQTQLIDDLQDLLDRACRFRKDTP